MTTYALVNPVVAVVLGAVVLGERVTTFTAIAAVVVLAGVALVLFQSWAPHALWQRWSPRSDHVSRLRTVRESK